MKHNPPMYTDNNQTPSVPAANFVGTVASNVDNKDLSDKAFRQFIRNTLPIVIYDRPVIGDRNGEGYQG